MCITILEFLQSVLEDTIKLEEKKTKKKLKEVGNTQLKRTVNSINHSLYIYKFMINCLLIVDIKKPTLSQTDKFVFVCLRLEIDFLF